MVNNPLYNSTDIAENVGTDVKANEIRNDQMMK